MTAIDDLLAERNRLMDERLFLMEQNEALHAEIDYIRSLVWNGDPSISDRKIVDDVRGLLDRPKLGRLIDGYD